MEVFTSDGGMKNKRSTRFKLKVKNMKTTTEKLAITEHEYEMMVLAFTPVGAKA
jgi:hypothetical protein